MSALLQRQNFVESVKVLEAVEGKSTLRLQVIKAGLNVGGHRFYPMDVLAASVAMYEGVKMYMNHATWEEEMDRPEGDLYKWVGVLENVSVADDGLVGEAKIIDPEFLEKVRLLEGQGHLNKLGVSHNIIGTVREDDVDGIITLVVDEIVKVRSVDFVTEPGAGGRAVALESAADTDDVTLIGLERLRERRPDLVGALTNEIERTFADMATVEELEKRIAAQESATADALKRADEAEKKLKEAEDKAEADKLQAEKFGLIAESELPDVSKARFKKLYADVGTVDGLKEAIEEEKKYLESVTVRESDSGVRGNAASKESDEKGDDEADRIKEAEASIKKTYVDQFMAEGLSKEDAEARAAALV